MSLVYIIVSSSAAWRFARISSCSLIASAVWEVWRALVFLASWCSLTPSAWQLSVHRARSELELALQRFRMFSPPSPHLRAWIQHSYLKFTGTPTALCDNETDPDLPHSGKFLARLWFIGLGKKRKKKYLIAKFKLNFTAAAAVYLGDCILPQTGAAEAL